MNQQNNMTLDTKFDTVTDAAKYIRAMYIPAIYNEVNEYSKDNDINEGYIIDLPKEAVKTLYTEITINGYTATVHDWSNAGYFFVNYVKEMMNDYDITPDYDNIEYGDDDADDWYKSIAWIEGYIMAVYDMTTGNHKPTITK